MANAYVYTPASAALTLNGNAVAGLIEVFFAIRSRPAQTVESGAVAVQDTNVELNYTYRNAADVTPITAQGGPNTATNPLYALGIKPNATGVHAPIRKASASPGDTVEVVIGASNATYTVGNSTTGVADPLGLMLVTDNDTRIAREYAP